MYKVIKNFTDLQDNNYKYEIGDEYPRLGLNPSISRIKELSSDENKQRTPLIKEIENEKVLDELEDLEKTEKTKKRKSKKKS